MATLAKLLQVEMGLPEMAERLAAAGRGKDSILAHINPREAKLLKAHGGSGKKNPRTGIVEFDDYDQPPDAGEADASSQQQARDAADSSRSQPAYQDLPPQSRVELTTPRVTGLDLSSAPAAAPAFDPYAGGNDRAAIPAAAPGQTDAEIAAAGERFKTPRELGFQPGGSAAPTPTSLVPESQPQAQQPGLAQQVSQGAKAIGNYAGGLSEALKPAVPFLKGGLGAFMGITGAQNQRQAQQQAAANEQELRNQANQYRSQGQKLVDLGQAGGLTAPQQQALEVQRAVAAQRMASSGVTGGTAQAQIEADLSRQAATFAQQNIDQGNKLLQIADADVLKAIQTGYAQDQDAQKLARDMYQNVVSNLFGGTGNTGSPGQQKITDATEEPQ